MKLLTKLFLVFFMLPILVCAKTLPPTEFNTYDGVPVGGRALGMGQTFVGLADDPYAVYWNPAGLLQLKRNIFGISFDVGQQSKLETAKFIQEKSLQGRKLTFFSFASPQGAVFYRPLSNFQSQTDLGVDSWEKREVKVYALGLTVTSTYGKDDSLLAGINFNYLNGRLVVAKKAAEPEIILSDGNGFSADLGLIFRATPVMNLGISVQNFPGYVWWEDYLHERLPIVLRTGVSLKLSDLLIFTSDYENRFYHAPFEKLKSYHLGLEQALGKVIFLRTGLYGEDLNDPTKLHYTFGLGYAYDNYYLDFSLDKTITDVANIQNQLYSYGFSLTLPFGE